MTVKKTFNNMNNHFCKNTQKPSTEVLSKIYETI